MGNKQGKASRARNKARRDALKISANQKRKAKYAALAEAGNNRKITKKLKRKVRIVKTFFHTLTDINCGNPACETCYGINKNVITHSSWLKEMGRVITRKIPKRYRVTA